MEIKKKILIVDDDPRNIFALELSLRVKGFRSVTAQSAKEGLDILAHDSEVALILMDMMMPDMDGYQAIQQIRTTENRKHIPIVAVTAQAMTGDREKCLAAGANSYVSKPIDIDKLLSTIRELL